MSLRSQTLLLLSIVLLLGLGVLGFSLNWVVSQATARMEQRVTESALGRVRRTLENELAQLDTLVHDWSSWDDSYVFAADHNDDYIRANLAPTTYATLHLAFIAYFDAKKQTIYAVAYDPQAETLTALPAELQHDLQNPNSPLMRASEVPQRGLLAAGNRIFLVSARPILNTAEQGPSRGTLIFARTLDEDKTDSLGKIADVQLSLLPWDDDRSQRLRQRHPTLNADASANIVEPLDENRIVGLTTIKDVANHPLVLAYIELPREANQAARISMFYGFIALSILGLVIISSVLGLSEYLVLKPLANLTKQVHRIAGRQDATARVHLHARKELVDTAASINLLLASLDAAQQKLESEQARYRAIVQDQTEWIVRFLPDGQLTFANDAFCRAFGLVNQQWQEVNWFNRFPLDAKRELNRHCAALTQTHVTAVNLRVQETEGAALKWQAWTLRSILDERGNMTEIQAVGQDVTERQESVAKLHYLGTHDALTGLYNRAYFEAQLKLLDNVMYFPVSIMIADLDDLKLTNDQYGHVAGDALLRAVAQILVESFRKDDIVARIGGDEFAIVLLNTDAELAARALSRLRARLHAHSAASAAPALSLSLGRATTYEPATLQSALLQADQRMYEEKFARRPMAHLSNTLGVSANQEILSLLASAGTNATLADNVFDFSRVAYVERALQASEARYRALLELLPVVTYVSQIGDDGPFLFVSQQVEKLLGFAVSEFLQDPTLWTQCLHPDDREPFARAKEHCLLTGAPLDIEYRMRARDGELLWIQDRARVIRLEEDVSLLHGVVLDITARKQTEVQLRQQSQEFQSLFTLTKVMNRGESLDAIFNAALQSLVTILDAPRAAILLYDETGVMRFRAWHQLSDEYRQHAEGHSPWTRDSIDPPPVLIQDVMQEPSLEELRPHILREGIRALGFVPLLRDGHLLGKFMVYYDAVHVWSENEVRLAQTIANQTAIAIARTDD